MQWYYGLEVEKEVIAKVLLSLLFIYLLDRRLSNCLCQVLEAGQDCMRDPEGLVHLGRTVRQVCWRQDKEPLVNMKKLVRGQGD
jgi:hypothetical protein